MREPDLGQFRPRREDVLVSVCLAELSPGAETFAKLRALAARLDAAFRFREIVLVVDETARAAFLPIIAELANLRLFVVRRGTEYYQRRVIAAEEAIGDLVVIGHLDELARLDLIAFLDLAERENAVAMAFRPARRPIKRLLAWPFIALGKLAGFHVDPSDFQSLAVPRTALNLLLAHEEPRLALRFPPRDPRIAVEWLRTGENVESRTAFIGLARRAQLFQTLLVHLTPAVLSLVSLTSALLAALGLAYGAYVGVVALVKEALAPGWLTTNAMLAASAAFMGFSTLGLSLGLQYLLRQQARGRAAPAPEEVNQVDLYAQVAFDLNVAQDRGAG